MSQAIRPPLFTPPPKLPRAGFPRKEAYNEPDYPSKLFDSYPLQKKETNRDEYEPTTPKQKDRLPLFVPYNNPYDQIIEARNKTLQESEVIKVGHRHVVVLHCQNPDGQKAHYLQYPELTITPLSEDYALIIQESGHAYTATRSKIPTEPFTPARKVHTTAKKAETFWERLFGKIQDDEWSYLGAPVF